MYLICIPNSLGLVLSSFSTIGSNKKNKKSDMKSFIYLPSQMFLVAMIVLSGHTAGKRMMPTNHVAQNFTGETSSRRSENDVNTKEFKKEEAATELFPTGSSLPDCTHACGPCFPCRRVILSFKCPMAESCPVVYRCMCKGKYYQVPSS